MFENLDVLLAVLAFIGIVIFWSIIQVVRDLLAKQKQTIARQSEEEGGLRDMFISVDPQKLFYYNIAALFIVPALLWGFTGNLVLVVGAAIVIIILPKLSVNWLKKRRFEKFEKQLPDALLMVSGAMRAGASLTVAMESMVKEQKPPLAQEFDLLLREQRVGVDFDTALRNMEKRLPIQDFIMVVSGMRISREVGGNLADILETLADTLRMKHQMEGKIKALTAQGKMQGLVMTCLPLFLMFILTHMEPEAMEPLYNTFVGWGTLAVIAVMEVVGYMAIQKIVSIDV
ncbi:MAG: type II secretion system F family protein [Burkholderiales bacterium]|nr:type II secretion system F family protein [Burkholderiales bacterium]MCW5605966.1 type II secretion system F family protein [Burkholderiales bacterium]